MLDTAGASYPERTIIFRKILEHESPDGPDLDGILTVKDLVEDTEYPQATLIEEIEKLSHLGLIDYFDGKITFTHEYFDLAMSLYPYIVEPTEFIHRIREQGRNE